jgi:autotransporter-associated beta strand protein
LVNARSPIYLRNNNTGSSTFQLDGTAGDITQTQRLWLGGRTAATVAVQNLAGSNSLGGVTVDVGGSNYILQSDAGTLSINGSITSQATGTRTVTFQGAGRFYLQGGVVDGNASISLSKTGAGTLLLNSAAAHTGRTSVSGGTLQISSNGSLSAGSLSVTSGATLLGSGSIGANTTLAGLHSPDSVQTFTGSLAYAASARLLWQLSDDTLATSATFRVAAASVNVSPGAALDLKLDGGRSTTDYFDAFWTQPRAWSALSATAQTGAFTLGTVSPDALGKSAATAGAFTLAQTATGVTVQWTPRALSTWRATSFAALAGDPATAAFDADPDADGLKNGLEYFLGSAPAAAETPTLATQLIDSRLALTFNRNPAATDVTATVQAADSPSGPWTDLVRSTGGASFVVLAPGASATESEVGGLLSVDVRDAVLTDTANPRRFLRLLVTDTAP